MDLIRAFYGGFEKTLEDANEKLKGVKIKVPEEVTDVICEKCGRNMVIRSGKNGKFLACPASLNAGTQNRSSWRRPAYVRSAAAKCSRKKSKNGKTYFGCRTQSRVPVHDLG